MATRKRAKGPESTEQHAGIGDAAVARRTGKGWGEWFALLDRAGARRLDHAAIAALLHREHRVAGWWAQMITVAWEQARGRRVRHQGVGARKTFEVSVSRTVGASPAGVWRALTDGKQRAGWLVAPKLKVRTQTPPARMRIDWKDATIVEFQLYAKGPQRCQLVVQHLKLADAKTAKWMKACWGRALDRLKEMLQR